MSLQGFKVENSVVKYDYNALDNLPSINNILRNFASSYTRSIYNVGDYVLYEQKLYKCNTKITTGQAWTPQHWTEVVFADQVKNIRNQTSDSISNVVASEYDTSASYGVGGFCIYNDDLYKCTVAIIGGQAWNANHWTKVQIADQVEQTNNDIIEFINNIAAEAYDRTAAYSVNDYCFYNGGLYRCTVAILGGQVWNPAHWTKTVFADQVKRIDTSLNQAGMAADSKAVGDAIDDIKDLITQDFDPFKVYKTGQYCYHNGQIYKCLVDMTNAQAWIDAHWELTRIMDQVNNGNDNLASEYSLYETYQVGDYCMRGGKLYKCVTPISVVEIWTPSHWQEAVLADNMIQIDNSLSQVGKAADAKAVGDKIDSIVENNIAQAYDATKTYAVGDYVTYENVLYKCKTAITTAEAWTVSRWMQVSIAPEVSDLKSELQDLNYMRFDTLPYNIGNMSNSGTWNQLRHPTEAYRYKVIPVKPYDVIKTSFESTISIGFLTAYTKPSADGEVINFSTAEGYTSKISTGKSPRTYKVPADCNYLVIENYINGNEYDCLMLKINGYEYTELLNDNLVNILYKIEDALDSLNWEIGAINSSTGADASSTTRVRSNNIFVSEAIKIVVPDGMKARTVTYLSDESVITSGWINKDFVYYPRGEETVTVRIFGGYSDDRTISDARMVGSLFELYRYNIEDNSPICYGIGDSLIQGFYSYNDGVSDSIAVTENCWINIAMSKKRHRFVNHGVGGSGFVHNGTVLDKLNAKDHVDNIDFSKADYVVMAYGINDWKYNEQLGTINSLSGDGTIYGNMKYVVEKILNDNPSCKIFVVTPINSANTTKTYGTKETNWGLGYELSNSGTLEDVFKAEKDIAEYYGLQLIDQTHESCVNRENLLNVLIDGVHPSLSCHTVIGMEMANKITFG